MLTSQDDGIPVTTQAWSFQRRFTVASILLLAIGFLVFATAGSTIEGRVSGAGSTLANPVLQHVSTAFQGYVAADRVDPTRMEGTSRDWSAGSGALDYDPVGSVGGLVRLSDPAVIFAATDVPVLPDMLAEKAWVQFPLINGAAAPVVNLDLGGAALTLDADTLAGIFSGRITRWTDPAITALNEGLTLPDLPIAVRHRSDGSGTTWVFTGFLARSAGWTAGRTAKLDWPVGEGAKGNGGVIEAVKATPGAIGYAEIGQARRAGLGIAQLRNETGGIVVAEPATIRAAVSTGFWSADGGLATDAATSEGWPMTATVFVVMRRDGATARTERALSFFRYFYAEARREAEALGYVALPPEIVSEVEASWTTAFKPNS